MAIVVVFISITIRAVYHKSDMVTASCFETIVRVISPIQWLCEKRLKTDAAVNIKHLLKDEGNSELAGHLWLVYLWHEETPLGNLSWMRDLVFRNIGERDGPVGSGIRHWSLLVSRFVEVRALDGDVHCRVSLVVARAIGRGHLHCLALKLADLGILRASVVIWVRIRAGDISIGCLGGRSWSSMRVTLSKCMVLLRHGLGFELVGWHMSLTAVVIRVCVRTIITCIGVRCRSKCRVIGVIDVTPHEILRVRIGARRR